MSWSKFLYVFGLVLVSVAIYHERTWFSDFYQYCWYCIENVRARPAWQQFLLFAPALLFDTLRYYLSNILCALFQLIKNTVTWFFPDTSEPYLPFVSVVIPTYNEGDHLRVTLDSAINNDYPNFEVIVVDDCSSDESYKICQQYERQNKIRYFRKATRGGKSSSLNYGLLFAEGEIIIHMDGDSELDSRAIFEAVQPLRDPRVGCVSGNLKVLNADENLLTLLQATEFSMSINVQRRWLAMVDMLQIASGAYGIFRKEILQQCLGTDPEDGEDNDITLKIRKLGYKVKFAHKSIAYTEMPNNLKAIFKQRLRWDRCYIRLSLRKHLNIINPFRFRLGDFVAGSVDFLMNLVLLLLFPFYVAWILIYAPELFIFIIVTTYLFYTLMNFIQFSVQAFLSDRFLHDLQYILLTPIFFIYSQYLKVTRALAYVLEISRSKKLSRGYFPDLIRKNMPYY